MTRRIGEPVKRGVTYRRRPGVYAILERNGQILLTHQAEPAPEYQLPGGGIDPGENLIPALHREVMEETGWRISNLRRVGFYRRFTYMVEYGFWAEKICHIFMARPVLQIGPPTESMHTAIWTTHELAIEIVESEGDKQFLIDTF